MAPVSSESENDRGQLILVTGLLIAFVLVTLVLLLNGAIYTENLSTRGVDKGANDAMEYQQFVVDNTDEVIERNQDPDHVTLGEDEFVEEIEAINETAKEHYLERGVVTDIEVVQVPVTSPVTCAELRITYETAEIQYETTVEVPDGCI